MPEYSSTENIVAPATAQFASPQSKNQKNDIIKRTIQGVIVALIYAHFAWASIYFIKNTGMIPPMVLSKLCNNNSKKK
jgi:hypothetical protein